MKNKLERFIALLLASLMVLSAAACASGDNGKGSDAKDISLSLYGTYTDAAWGSAEIDPDDCSSEDEKIAYVGFDGQIEGARVGTTVVKVMADEKTYVYNVTVKNEEDRDAATTTSSFRPGTSVKKYNLYLGAGYNAFTAAALPTANDLNVSCPIILARDINAYLSESEKNLQQDMVPDMQLLNVSESTVDKASKSYTDEISGSLQLALSDIGNIAAEGKYSKIKKNQTATAFAMSSVVRYQRMYTFWIDSNVTTVRNLAMKNTDFWDDLTDKDVDPEDLFETYGTHVVLGIVYGGRVAMDYQLSSESASMNDSTLVDVAGKLNLKISSVNASVAGKYMKEEADTLETGGVSSTFRASVVGGPITDISSFESYGNNFSTWLSGLMSDDSTWAVIGVRNGGLIPIWKLLPKTEKERANQIKQAYNEKAAELKNAK